MSSEKKSPTVVIPIVLLPCPCSGPSAAAPARSSGGPAQVATPEYLTSWERTFGGKPAVRGQA